MRFLVIIAAYCLALWAIACGDDSVSSPVSGRVSYQGSLFDGDGYAYVIKNGTAVELYLHDRLTEHNLYVLVKSRGVYHFRESADGRLLRSWVVRDQNRIVPERPFRGEEWVEDICSREYDFRRTSSICDDLRIEVSFLSDLPGEEVVVSTRGEVYAEQGCGGTYDNDEYEEDQVRYVREEDDYEDYGCGGHEERNEPDSSAPNQTSTERYNDGGGCSGDTYDDGTEEEEEDDDSSGCGGDDHQSAGYNLRHLWPFLLVALTNLVLRLRRVKKTPISIEK